MSNRGLRGAYFGLSALVIAADRITKYVVAHRVVLNYESIPVLPGLFSITHVENSGAAFSMFADWPAHVRVPLLIGFSATAMLVVGWMLWRSVGRSMVMSLALAFILGGAVGNLYDRILYGRVTDFLHFYIGTHVWPDFNLADSAIVCGAVLLGWELIFGGEGHTA
jgi:signal peptidase II